MDISVEKERLLQKRRIELLSANKSVSEMITVYYSHHEELSDLNIYCALVPQKEGPKFLQNSEWILSLESGFPDMIEYHNANESRSIYSRFGNDDGIEPLIIYCHFYNIKPDHCEISEEFRLFHHLYYDASTNRYLKVDESGRDEVVIVVEKEKIQIRLKEIKEFLAVKHMSLFIQFDFNENIQLKLKELGLSSSDGYKVCDSRQCWFLSLSDFFKTGSRLVGKIAINSLIKESRDSKYENFIIGEDDKGQPVSFPSNPAELSDYFGKNRGKPSYLTPVHFRKTVLDKYYQQPSKYSIEDGALRCGCLWLLSIDNHHKDRVIAYLGDIGRSLPYEEQVHWKSENIIPLGGISEVAYKRDFLAQPTDSQEEEHVFQERYKQLETTSRKLLSAKILLPLTPEDSYHLKIIRVPANEECSGFDSLVLSLTKIIVDSLNEKLLNTLLPVDSGKKASGISLLEQVLENRAVPGFQEQIQFLRELQTLRSAGSAHRKGKEYSKICKKFGIGQKPISDVYREILSKANSFLSFFIETIQNKFFS